MPGSCFFFSFHSVMKYWMVGNQNMTSSNVNCIYKIVHILFTHAVSAKFSPTPLLCLLITTHTPPFTFTHLM